MKLFIAREGYDVSTARDGAEALNATASDKPDLAIIDIQLPGMKGGEACRKLREMHSDMRVIFVSAYGREDNTVQELVQIGDGYITKPFELNALLKEKNP